MVASIENDVLAADVRGNCVDSLIGDISVAEVVIQRERRVQRKLAEAGIGCYVPLQRVKRVYGGRKVTDEVPLFPGYAFISGGLEGQEAARRVYEPRGRCVYDFVEWGLLADGGFDPRAQRLLRGELADLERVLATRPDTAFPELREGQLVRILGGKFDGNVQGRIERRDRLDYFIVRTNFIGAGAAIEVEPHRLEAVTEN